jgi:hypothetical protein
MMNGRNIFGPSIIAVCGLSLLPANALSQSKSLKDQLVGTWTLVSVVEVYQDGRKENPWGPAVKGAVSFDPKGNVILAIIGGDAYFGKYVVDEAAKTVTYTAERATEPSFDGLARKASVTVEGDELKQTSAPITAPRGTFTPNLVFKRAN